MSKYPNPEPANYHVLNQLDSGQSPMYEQRIVADFSCIGELSSNNLVCEFIM